MEKLEKTDFSGSVQFLSNSMWWGYDHKEKRKKALQGWKVNIHKSQIICYVGMPLAVSYKVSDQESVTDRTKSFDVLVKTSQLQYFLWDVTIFLWESDWAMQFALPPYRLSLRNVLDAAILDINKPLKQQAAGTCIYLIILVYVCVCLCMNLRVKQFKSSRNISFWKQRRRANQCISHLKLATGH